MNALAVGLGDGEKERLDMKDGAVTMKETKRDKPIKSAERLFAARGFDGVSVRDIANGAKVNSALLGYYFGGKEGLLTEVYTRHR